jgi:hypothetical protein
MIFLIIPYKSAGYKNQEKILASWKWTQAWQPHSVHYRTVNPLLFIRENISDSRLCKKSHRATVKTLCYTYSGASQLSQVVSAHLPATTLQWWGGIMKHLLLLPALLFLILGCTTTYYHPSKSPQEFDQDRVECEQIVRQSMAAQGIENCWPAVLNKETGRCLETKKGWKRAN